MTLEAAIQENTAVLRELIAAINAQAAGGAALKTATITNKTVEGVKAPTASPAPSPAETTKDPAAPAPAAPNADGADAEEVTYQDAAKAVTNLAKAKGRPAAEEVLKQFGANKLPDVKPEDFAAVVKACNEAAEA